MRALLGVFLFFFIAFIILVLMLVRFFMNITRRDNLARKQQRQHRRYYSRESDSKSGVEVMDTRSPESRNKKVIPDSEGEYVEPIE